jgi:hypothetical protein
MKEEQRQIKRAEKQKVIRRFAKRRHHIAPGVLGVAAMCMLAGATVMVLSVGDYLFIGALAGTWIGLIVFVPLIIRDISK